MILSLASGYTYEHLEPFIRTLKNTGYSGDIVFFVSNLSDETTKRLEEENIILVPFQNTYPFLNEPLCSEFEFLHVDLKDKSPLKLRHILYYLFLQAKCDHYQHAMLSDVRDVVFQKDPFDFDIEPGLYCFLEDVDTPIAKEYYNSLWIKGGYGADELKKIGDKTICCAGVTIGDIPSMLYYLHQMIEEILVVDEECVDQGIHNYLVYNNKLRNVHLIPDDAGAVTTLSYFKKYNKIVFKEGLIINTKGEPVNIIHQYDRHLSLLWKYSKPAFKQKVINLTKKRFYFLKKMYNAVTGAGKSPHKDSSVA
jgi:hypothetical protein